MLICPNEIGTAQTLQTKTGLQLKDSESYEFRTGRMYKLAMIDMNWIEWA